MLIWWGNSVNVLGVKMMLVLLLMMMMMKTMMIDYANHDGNGVGDDVDAEKDYMDGSFDKDNDGWC